MNTREALLIVADSEKDANMLYAAGIFVPDPFIFLQCGRTRRIVLSDLEIDRGRREASVDVVLSFSKIAQQLKVHGYTAPRPEDVIAYLLLKYRVRSVKVPSNFPLSIADPLRKRGFKVRPQADPFFPEREFKSAKEISAIRDAVRAVEMGFDKGVHALRRARIRRDKKLLLDGEILTSERLRAIINTTLLSLGFVPKNTIVAAGRQSCDPHERGTGPIPANEPIIIDIFPRSEKTRYYGDFTRTVLKGRPSPRLKEMYATVLEGQRRAIAEIREGASGKSIHQGVLDFFRSRGFPTGKIRGRMQGFFHGTGHGVGLDIHEPPRIGPTPDILKKGHVVTVEPGLYYPDLGGVRLEDIVVVEEKGARNLMKYKKFFEIPPNP